MGQFGFSGLIKGRPQYYHVLSPLDFFHFLFPPCLSRNRPTLPPPVTLLQTQEFQLSFNHSTIERLDFGKMKYGSFSFHFFPQSFHFGSNFIVLMNLVLQVFDFQLQELQEKMQSAPCFNQIYSCRPCCNYISYSFSFIFLCFRIKILIFFSFLIWV